MAKLRFVEMMKQRFKNMPIRNKLTTVCISIMLALVVLILMALDYGKRSFADIHSILFVDARKNMVSVGLSANPD